MTPFHFDIPTFLAGSMVIFSVILASRMRLASLLGVFRYQSAFLALYALSLAIQKWQPDLIVIALVLLIVKVIVIPMFLLHAARQTGAEERLQSYLRPTVSSLIALMAALAAAVAAREIVPQGSGFIIVACAFSMILSGLLLLISRKDMFGQSIGFLVMENGVFAFGLALTGGMPLFVEIAVLFDLLGIFIIMVALLRLSQKVHASVSTEFFRRLTD